MDSIKDTIRSSNINFIRFETEDFNGLSNGFALDVDHFLKQNKREIPYCIAANFCTINGQVPYTGTNVEIDYRNGYAYYDLDTFRILPNMDDTASILIDLKEESLNENSLSLSMFSTRAQCKNQIKNLNQIGMKLLSAFELEFYFIDEKCKNFSQVYSTLDNMFYAKTMKQIMKSMKAMGIKPELFHVEGGSPGQMEIPMQPAFDITSCDNMFMSKPCLNHKGSSGHFNHSLWNLEGTKNYFYNETHPKELSEIGQQWLAGLQYHHEALTALSVSTVNCYDRIDPITRAPSANIWGYDNRSVCYRVKTLGDRDATYIENRLPGAATNPYLVLYQEM